MRSSVGFGLLLAVCVAAGCDESLSDFTGPTRDLQPTFSSIQEEIFSASDSAGRRACTDCHNTVGSRFNGLDLSPGVSYNNLVGVASRFKAGAEWEARNAPSPRQVGAALERIQGPARQAIDAIRP